jgi:hypothetical protein
LDATLALLGLLAVRVSADFEGASIERAEIRSPAEIRITVRGETDQQQRNRQASWYFFRVDDATPRTPLTIDLTGLPGEYNFQPNRGAITGATPPWISYDQRTWTLVDTVEYDAAEPRLRLRLNPTRPRFWIAHIPPYTDRQFGALRRRVRAATGWDEKVFGTTPQGRDLVQWRFGAGPRTIVLMFRQHSWEAGTSYVAEGVVAELMREPALGRAATWFLLPLSDPDGVARGGVRFNHAGFDLNRNWDLPDDFKLRPEITAQRAALRRIRELRRSIDLFITFHNTETSEYLDGPAEPGQRLFAALEKKSNFDPSRPPRVEPLAGLGRMNVYQWVAQELQAPAFLIENRIARGGKLGRLPGPADRRDFGRALARVLAESN